MRKENENIQLSGAEAIGALREIEYVLISLKKIASYYYERADAIPTETTSLEYALETTRFIDVNAVTRRLAKVRKTISTNFNKELSEDDMSDVERALATINYWKKPGD
jgi:hypothetical protein